MLKDFQYLDEFPILIFYDMIVQNHTGEGRGNNLNS